MALGERAIVQLRPMSEAEFDSYMRQAVPSYAQAHIEAGDVDPGEALARAQADYDALLPEGLRTRDQYLWTIADDAHEAVGMMWFEVRERERGRSAYIFDIAIREDRRRRGYARIAMSLLEERLNAMSIGRVSLNVFGNNHAARTLYEAMGYRVTGIGMTKVLARTA